MRGVKFYNRQKCRNEIMMKNIMEDVDADSKEL